MAPSTDIRAQVDRFVADLESLIRASALRAVETALGMGAKRVGAGLPKWRTIKGLDPATSAAYQLAALPIARERGVTWALLDPELF
jgi:hypothetical protein